MCPAPHQAETFDPCRNNSRGVVVVVGGLGYGLALACRQSGFISLPRGGGQPVHFGFSRKDRFDPVVGRAIDVSRGGDNF